METFSGVRDFVKNPHYTQQRQACLRTLDIGTIDAPIVDIVSDLAKLPYCFTLQSCYGHFLPGSQTNPNNINPLPVTESATRVEYRIAYLAICIDNNRPGRVLFDDLAEVPAVGPGLVQFGCADWFWDRQVNSFALQVEPERHKTRDRVIVDYSEALHIQNTRTEFFARIRDLLDAHLKASRS